MDNKTLLYEIKKLIIQETIFMRTYIGKVSDNKDTLKLGRIKVDIFDLSLVDDSGIWCPPVDKNSIKTPKIGDYVRVGFHSNKGKYPYYFGIANEMDKMLPKAFDGKETTQVLFQDNDDNFSIVYDSQNKKIEVKDNNNNDIVIDQNGIDIKDGNNNEIIFKSGEMDIKSTLLKLLGATESYVKGDSFKTALDTFTNLIKTHTHTFTGTGTVGTSSELSPITNPVTSNLSTKIKGE